MNRSISSIFFIFIIIASCGRPQRENVDFEQWGGYWFQGNAEISSYDLTQYQYGEARTGNSVLIFVTEEFSRSDQVKLDDPEASGRDKISVLKMNQTRDFITGIYPYHMMLSAFTPTREQSQTIKLTSSVQEWCGQTFTQMNLRSGEKYNGRLYSYFEQEGDQDFTVSGLAEDELWNLIRIGPNQIPIGSVMLLPSLNYQRFTHTDINPEEAFLRINDISPQRSQLEVTYSSGRRVLRINFEKEFPYEIMGWEEEFVKTDGQKEITTAVRKSVKVIDYWNKNKVEDEFLRKELMLD